MQEKYLVAVRQWSLGFLKETVYRGNVIAVDRTKNLLTIDGREFQDLRDIDIAIRQAARFPNAPLIVPFTKENVVTLQSGKQQAAVQKPRPGENMQIINSDEDLHEDIDISGTQVSRINKEAKEASRKGAKTENLSIIKGDETPEERVVRIRADKPVEKMPIVQDDSLGVEVGSKAAALNAGIEIPVRAEVLARESEAKAKAEARKRQAEEKRVVVAGDKEGDAEIQSLVDKAEAPVQAPVETSVQAPVETPVRKAGRPGRKAKGV